MRLAAVQMDAAVIDPEARRTTIVNAIAEAVGEGADAILFPELAVTGYGAGEALRTDAMIASEALAFWQKAAEDQAIAIVLGLAVRSGEAAANAAACLRPGEEPVVYEKRVLYGDYEKALFAPGRTASPIVEIAGLRCGLLVCFDVEFPELVRDLALRGAQAILVPTALPRGASARFIAEHVVPVRAFENQIFIAYPDHCGEDASFAYQGLSVIAAPDGSLLAQADDRTPDILYATLDARDHAQSRADNPYLHEWRKLV